MQSPSFVAFAQGQDKSKTDATLDYHSNGMKSSLPSSAYQQHDSLQTTLIQNQQQQEQTQDPLIISTDSQIYSDKQPLFVYGKTAPNSDLILRIFAPDGHIVKFDQIKTQKDGTFEYMLFKWPNVSTKFPYGTYTVEALITGEGISKTINIRFAETTEKKEIPIQRDLELLVFAPQTGAIKSPFRAFVQITSDGSLLSGKPGKLLANSHVHHPDGTVQNLGKHMQTLHQGLYFADITPDKEGTYVFHFIASHQGTISHASYATMILKQNIEGISDQIIKLNNVLEKTSTELNKVDKEVESFGGVLEQSQESLTEANKNIDKSVSTMAESVNRMEEASGQFNALFLPIVALIGIILALQIAILARRR